MRAQVKQVLWWAWQSLGRARIEPEIVPDPPLHSTQIHFCYKIEILLPQNKNYAGVDRALFQALFRLYSDSRANSDSTGEAVESC